MPGDLAPDLEQGVFSPGINPENDTVSFFPPVECPPEVEVLAARIVKIDHSSLGVFKRKSPEREEVKSILLNAAVLLASHKIAGCQYLVQEADSALSRHLCARNRVQYLLGMLLSIGLLLTIAISITFVDNWQATWISKNELWPLIVFAGIGSIASILTRLSSINLRNVTSTPLLLVSGATRPIVAFCFALVVFLILDSGAVSFHFGEGGPEKRTSVLLIAAFLCGFSERFAVELLGKVGGDGRAGTKNTSDRDSGSDERD